MGAGAIMFLFPKFQLMSLLHPRLWPTSMTVPIILSEAVGLLMTRSPQSYDAFSWDSSFRRISSREVHPNTSLLGFPSGDEMTVVV